MHYYCCFYQLLELLWFLLPKLETLFYSVRYFTNKKITQGTSVVQILSGTVLDDLGAAYVLAVENFKKAAHLVFGEHGAHGITVDTSSVADTSLTTATGHFLFLFPAPFFYMQLYLF